MASALTKFFAAGWAEKLLDGSGFGSVGPARRDCVRRKSLNSSAVATGNPLKDQDHQIRLRPVGSENLTAMPRGIWFVSGTVGCPSRQRNVLVTGIGAFFCCR